MISGQVQYTRLERETMWRAFGQPTHWLTLEFADDASLEKGFQVGFEPGCIGRRGNALTYWTICRCISRREREDTPIGTSSSQRVSSLSTAGCNMNSFVPITRVSLSFGS